MQYFSVAYKPLAWPLPAFMQPISITDVGPGVENLGTRCPEFAELDPLIGEYATLFALRRVLADTTAPEGEMVGVSHYRRFAVTIRAKALAWDGKAATPAEFAKMSRDRFLPPWGTILHPHLIRVEPSMVAHYSRYHHTRDLLTFMGLAVDMGVVDDREVGTWLGGDVLIPAASVGVFPLAWWSDTMAALEEVAMAFLATHALPREGYQRRAAAFCLERLHSLLLVKLVQSWDPGRVIAEPELIVDPRGTYTGNFGDV